MATARHAGRSPLTGQPHTTTGRTNPWLDTVLSTEPIPLEPTSRPRKGTLSKKPASPVTRPQPSSIQKPKRTDPPVTRRQSSSTRKPIPSKPPAQSTLDEAFKAAIRAIVPEREAAARKAKRANGHANTTARSPHMTTMMPIPHQPPKPKLEPELRTAIGKLTLTRLRSVVYKTLNSSPQARAIFEKEVLTAPPPPPPPPVDSDVDEDETAAATLRRRIGNKRPRFEVCRLCKQEYNVTENAEDSCVHHSGALEPDERAWRHHNVTEHGPIDTAENRENHPDCFMWDCCSREGDDDGCETTTHEVDEPFNPNKTQKVLRILMPSQV